MINILFFAGIAEKIGLQEMKIKKQELSISQLRSWLIEQYPQIETDISQAMMAVNEEIVEEQTIIKDNDVVALIPPVSGG